MWYLFEKRDRVSQSEYNISAQYESSQLRSRYMRDNCGKWALEAIDVLESLHDEIQILFSISTTTWDPNILAEAVNLLQFLMNFLGDLSVLKDVCKNSNIKNLRQSDGFKCKTSDSQNGSL